METILRDIRYGGRMLLRNPGITAVAVLALALGIGANSAIFSVVYAVLLRPLPVRDVDRLVTMAMDSRKLNVNGAQPSFASYGTWKEHIRSFESIAAAAAGTATVSGGGTDQAIKFWQVSAGFLPALGIAPALGRNFLAEEDQPGARRVALLAYPFWQARFSGSRQALGTALKIDGESYDIVGVLPPGFHVDGRPADVYAPMARSVNARDYLPCNIYARLRPGVSIQQAQAEMDAYASRLDPSPLGWQTRLWPLRDFQVRNVRLSLWVLLGAVGLVLLIACANTATLLLARASARQKEIAMRTAMGAGRTRLVRQLLTESVMLALAGGACGVLVAYISSLLLPLLRHQRLPGLLEQTRVDGAVLAFTLGISVLTGLVFGIAPALAAPRLNVLEALKEGGRSGTSAGRRRGWNFLVISETALALVLAIGASLLIRTFFYLRDVAPGFRVHNLLAARITPPRGTLTSPPQARAYWKNVIERVRSIPGVQAASFAQALPMTGDNWVASWPVEGHPYSPRVHDNPVMWLRLVETDYFRTMQIPLRRGRLFSERDNAAAPRVVIVSEAFVRRFWPGQNPIGKHIGGGQDPLVEVIGVVGDVRAEDATKAAPLEIIFHYLQTVPPRIALAVRADPRVYSNPMALEPQVRKAVAAADPTLPVAQFSEMQRLVSDRVAPNRLSAQLIAVFAGLALVLAAVGIYGVLSFSVAQRTHEIGVRVALGAARSQVLGMVVGNAALLAGTGIAIGLAAAAGLTRILKSLLFGVGATDPWVYGGSSIALLAIAVVAALLPALRAAHVDPLVALRHE